MYVGLFVFYLCDLARVNVRQEVFRLRSSEVELNMTAGNRDEDGMGDVEVLSQVV